MHRTLLASVALLGGFLPSLAGEAAAEHKEGDFFTGKERREIVVLLGEPAKTKSVKSGEILSYKLVRLDDHTAPTAGMRVLDLPGIGVVGKIERAGGSPADDAMVVDPSLVDSKGRPAGGGLTGVQSAEASWDTKTREMKRPPEPQRPEAPPKGGRIKLEIRLDAGGRVQDWSIK